MGGSQSSSNKLERRRRDSLPPSSAAASLRKRMGTLLAGDGPKQAPRQQVAPTTECQLTAGCELSGDQRRPADKLAPVPVGGGGARSAANNYVSMARGAGLAWQAQAPEPAPELNNGHATRKPLHQLHQQQQYCSPANKPAAAGLVETSLDSNAGSSLSWLMGDPAAGQGWLAAQARPPMPATCCGGGGASGSPPQPPPPAFQLGKAVNSKTSSVLNNSHGVANGAARQPGACLSASLHLSTPALIQRHFYQQPSAHQVQPQLQQQPPHHQQQQQPQQQPQHQQQVVAAAHDHCTVQLYPATTHYTEAQVETTNNAITSTGCRRHHSVEPSSGAGARPGNQHQLHHCHEYGASPPTPISAGHQAHHHWYSRTLEAPGRRTKKKSLLARQHHSKPLVQSLFANIDNNNNNSHTSYHARGGAQTIHLSSSNNNKHLPFPLSASGVSGKSLRPVSSSGSLKRLKSGPLKARQASYEAMRTIDMYLVRQVAHTCMDFEMERKIDLEIRLRELAAQSMLEARTELDVLEVEKSLLASDQRMNCYALQLEQQRKQLSNPSLSTDSGRGSKSGYLQLTSPSRRPDVIGAEPGTGSPSFSAGESVSGNSQSPSKLSPVSGESANSPPSFVSSPRGSRGSRWRTGQRGRASSRSSTDHLTADQRARIKRRQQLLQTITTQSNINCNMVLQSKSSLSLSELRIPLMWRDVDHFKQRGDYKRYAVFCLLRIGSQIYDTQLISDVDRQVTDVTFDDVIVFNEVESDFELTLEVYSCVYLEQFSFGSTPRKLKEKLTSSVSRAMGRRLATQTASTNYTKELQAYQDKSYRFAMIASALLKLEHASNSVKTYDLVLVSPSAHNRQHLGTGSPLLDSLLASRHHNVTSLTVAHKDAHKNTLPLFGHFCCRLLVRPDVFDKNIRSGYLRVATISMPNHNHHHQHQPNSDTTLASSCLGSANNSPQHSSSDSASSIMEAASKHHFSSSESVASKLKASQMASMSMSSSQLYWAVLRNFTLQLWPVDERKLQSALTRNQLPMLSEQPLSFNIDKRTRLLRVSNSSLTLETDNACLVMAVYSMLTHKQHQHLSANATSEETGLWLRCVEQYIYDSHIWDNVLNRHQHHDNH